SGSAATAEKDDAVRGGLQVWRPDGNLYSSGTVIARPIGVNVPTTSPEAIAAGQPSHAIRSAQYCPESCNRADQVGVLGPITVRPQPNGYFWIVDGHHR